MSQHDEKQLLEYLRKVTADLVATRGRLDALTGDDPVAVVGLGCRFPGGIDTPEALWAALERGDDLVGDFPTDRGWADLPVTEAGPVPRRGAFLEDAAGFDHGFFKISPREAAAMDPQQRLSLEVAWDTLEAARIDPLSLKGSRTGVYLGATSFQYGGDPVQAGDEVAGHLLIGTVPSVLSGRISYTLGVHGPSLTLDTACSSALVAVHLAVEALRRGECDLALAGGATVMATPGVFAEFHRQGGLSSDGRCRAFSAEADGTGWGEAVTMVALERLSDARAAGHPVLALVRGTACNHGGAANGLTAPNGVAQRAVIRDALAAAGLTPDDIDAVEAHGTGTLLGDPLEANALIDVFGQRTPERPLWLGSLKSNTAHTQAASGTGGIIKMVLALRHGLLPRTLHADRPTDEVDWSRGGVQLLQQAQPWAADPERPRRAGVSAFGVGGTNAHVVLEEAPAATVEPTGQVPDPLLFTVSAADPDALAASLRRVGEGPASLDAAGTAAALVRRAALRHRCAVVVPASEASEALAQAAAGQAATDLVATGVAESDPRPVFVFPGQGSQWAGMAIDLLDSSPVFARRLAACDAALAPYLGRSVEGVLRASVHDPAVLAAVDVVQPTLWAVMVSLAACWEDLGVHPAAVIGHSQGELAGATVSGHLTLESAARVVALRSRALRALEGRGGMMSLFTDADHAQQLIAPWADDVAIAVVNGPGATVVAGPDQALLAVADAAEAAGVRHRRVAVDYASHSPQVDAVSDEIRGSLGRLEAGEPGCAWYSTVTGESHADAADADYWVDNLRSTVRLDRAVATAIERGHRLFIEISPHPVLAYPLRSLLDGTGAEVVGTLRREVEGPTALLQAAARAWVNGASVARDRLVPAVGDVSLPAYPFQHRGFWHAPATSSSGVDGLAVAWEECAVAASPVGLSMSVVAAAGDPLATALVDRLGERSRAVDLADDLAQALAHRPSHVVLVVPRDEPVEAAWAVARVAAALAGAPERTSLHVVTRGAQAIAPTDAAPDPGQAASAAVAGTLAAEDPGRPVSTVDLSGDTDRAELDALMRCVTAVDSEGYAIRGARVFCRRLQRRSTPPAPLPAIAGRAVVLGGLGRLGRAVALRLAEAGCRSLVVVSRHEPRTDEEREALRAVATRGCSAEIVVGDAADPAVLDRAFSGVVGEPLSLVVHAAGTVEDEPITSLTRAALDRVLHAKFDVARAVSSHMATQGVPLVLLSALPGTLSVAGQASWAAANAAVDALAAGRAAASLTCAVALSALTSEPAADQALARAGVTPLGEREAVACLATSLAHGFVHRVYGHLDLDTLVASGRVRRAPAISELLAAEAAGGATPEATTQAAQLDALPRDEAVRRVTDLARRSVADALGMAAEQVEDETPFRDLGLNSLTAIGLRNRLVAATGAALPVTLAFDRPTLHQLVDHLVALLVREPDPAADLTACVDQLGALMAALEEGHPARLAAVSRLRSALRTWGAPGPIAPQPQDDDALFAALDAELGVA